MGLFLIEKATITACSGLAVQDVKKVSGEFLVQTLNNQQSLELLNLQMIGDIDVKVILHTTLIITCLLYTSRCV